MLNSIHLNDKSYQELYDEALSQISIYSKEWTNFNASDPGITLLENLTAFNFLQQNRIDEITDEVRLNLLKLLDHRPAPNRAARLLVQAPADIGRKRLSAQYRLKTGAVGFETEQPIELFDWSVGSVYSVCEGNYRDLTYLMQPQTGSAEAFGQQPQQGDFLCLIINGELPESGSLRFWIDVSPAAARNPFDKSCGSIFGKTRWQIFTENGWQDTEFTDETYGLLISGAVTLKLPESRCAAFSEAPEAGYAVRCLLDSGSYDHPPRISGVVGNLFPVSQRETVSRCFSFDKADRISVESSLAHDGAVFVYCLEEDEQLYRAYREYSGRGDKGRFYTVEQTELGVDICFDEKRFGYAPAAKADCIKVICCTEDMLHHRSLGVVYGYDNQTVKVDFINDILPDAFSLLAEIPDGNGGSLYKFISPGKNQAGEISYELFSHEGAVKITDPGIGTEYRLYICDCASTLGTRGSIRQNSVLLHSEGQLGMESVTRFFSPSPTLGGSSWESPEQLRLRFSSDIRSVNTAVTAADYAYLAKNTPGLCIHKVNAWSEPVKNTVFVVVKPHSGNKSLPRLSDIYEREISKYLNERRMLTTRVQLLQPHYLAINVTAVLRTGRYCQSVEQQIKALLCQTLDHVETDAPFGGEIRFDEVYRAISRVSGITAIDALRLVPSDPTAAAVSGNDILLSPDTLCYCGDIRLEFHNEMPKRR